MLDGVFEAGHEVGVLGFAEDGYADFVHVWMVSANKDTKYLVTTVENPKMFHQKI